MNKNINPGGKGMKVVLIPPDQMENLLKNAGGMQGKDLIDTRELVSSLAIEIWRLEKRINKIKKGIQECEESSSPSLLDQMQRIKDIFKRQEIEVIEHTNDDYNDGLSLKVLHVESIDGIPEGKMKIIETVKPSVYLKGQVISYGEVIVGKSKGNEKKERNNG